MHRRPLSTVVLVTIALGLGASCGDDKEIQCTAVDASSAELLGLPVTFATEAPEEAALDGSVRFYYASPDGGLWIAFADPIALNQLGQPGDNPGLVAPVNDHARSESDLGTAATPGAPVLEGTDPASDEARAALDCASASDAPDAPTTVPASGVTAVYPDLDGNSVTIEEGPTGFTGDTPEPITIMDSALENSGCSALEPEYDFWLGQVDDPTIGDRASAYAAYALDIGGAAGCPWVP